MSLRAVGMSLLLLSLFAPVAQGGERDASTPRYRLANARAEAAPAPGSRYTANARLSPVASAGELREGENFVLIGRFAKAGVGCGPVGGAIFRNGFES